MPEVIEKSDPSTIAKSRAGVYHLISKFYLKEVSPEFLAVLKKKEMLELLNGLDVDFGKVLSNFSDETKFLDELATEYAALFIVGGGIPPYESARLKGMLCQEPEAQVRAFYKRCGLTVKDENKIFSDHLGMELEFMGYLADKEAEAWKNNDEKTAGEWSGLQKEFFTEHLDKWAFAFLKDMALCAFHPFYKEAVKLTRCFLELEKEDLIDSKQNRIESADKISLTT